MKQKFYNLNTKVRKKIEVYIFEKKLQSTHGSGPGSVHNSRVCYLDPKVNFFTLLGHEKWPHPVQLLEVVALKHLSGWILRHLMKPSSLELWVQPLLQKHV